MIVSDVDEDSFCGDSAAALSLVLAVAKARAVAGSPRAVGADLVIGCDSLLDLDGEILGKPSGPADAASTWRAMRGRSGTLVTGHCVIDVKGHREVSRVASTTVYFAAVSDDEIAAYVATGEPLHVAGAFMLDGLGAAFVTGIEGDPHNVVGISVALLRTMSAELGIGWKDLWESPR